jgi:hypothetical protein
VAHASVPANTPPSRDSLSEIKARVKDIRSSGTAGGGGAKQIVSPLVQHDDVRLRYLRDTVARLRASH